MYSIQRNKKETGSVLFSGGKNRLGVIILSRRGGGWENRLIIKRLIVLFLWCFKCGDIVLLF